MTARIALDAMGGDFFAVPNLQGAYRAVQRATSEGRDLKVFLVGPSKQVLGSLKDAVESDRGVAPELRLNIPQFEKVLANGKLEIVDCTQVVDMGDSPSTAVRTKKDSSLARAYQLVKEDKADAMISAGNSGAVMAFGIAMLGRLSQVRRPAILCHFPSRTGVTCVLDAGANVDCTSEHLLQFAQMGHIYSQAVFEKSNPKVALMNIGEEEGKGNELVKACHPLLRDKLGSDYVGFVEGRDVFKGKVDVIVCDGFVGNIILKTAEGVASVVKDTLKEEFAKSPIRLFGAWLARGGFQAMKSKMDYREYGAAPLVGLNGLGLVAHGSSDGKALMNAILIAEKYARQDLMKKLRDAFNAKEGQVIAAEGSV
mgnify:CR=1 FL=1